jgi:hypothetical protein
MLRMELEREHMTKLARNGERYDAGVIHCPAYINLSLNFNSGLYFGIDIARTGLRVGIVELRTDHSRGLSLGSEVSLHNTVLNLESC